MTNIGQTLVLDILHHPCKSFFFVNITSLFFLSVIYYLSVTSSYDVTPSLFSNKAEDFWLLSHQGLSISLKRGRKTRTCTRHVYVDLSSSPFSVWGWTPEEGADGTRRTPPPSPSPSILCCFYLPITYVHSSPFEIFPLLYPHVLHPPSLLGYTPVPPVPPTEKKKRREREKSWKRDPLDVICPRGIVVEEQ